MAADVQRQKDFIADATTQSVGDSLVGSQPGFDASMLQIGKRTKELTTGSNADKLLIAQKVLPPATIVQADSHQISPSRSDILVPESKDSNLHAPANSSSPEIRFYAKGNDRHEVTARQLTADGKFDTTDGGQEVKKGDWIVTDSKGKSHVASRDEFLKAFDPAKLDVSAPARKFIKSLPIEAELITQRIEWHNPDAAPGSPTEFANPGDYWAKPKGQAPYVIPGSYFKENYVQIPGLGEYARTSITTAQVLDRSAAVWSKNSGVTTGQAGDYLITRPNGNQQILSAQKFDEQFALAESAPVDREPLSKPKPTGPRFDLDKDQGVTAETWEHGLVIYDRKSVTVTDVRNSSAKEYVNGRLAGEIIPVQAPGGQRLITRTYPYGDLDTVRSLPSLDTYKNLLERRPELKRAQELSDSIPKTHTIDTAERIALRAEIGDEIRAHMDELRRSPAQDGTGAMKLEQGKNLHIVLGLSGSGKSTIANEIAAQNHAFIPDVDDIKPKLPEWQGGIGGAATSVEAHLINNPIVQESLASGDNLVVPLVGASTKNIEKLINDAKANGYQVHLSLVDVPPTEAMKRIVGRLEKGGLYVDPTYLASLGNRPIENFKNLVDKYFVQSNVLSSYHQINNMGKVPVLVEEGHVTRATDTSGLPKSFFAAADMSLESHLNDSKFGYGVEASEREHRGQHERRGDRQMGEIGGDQSKMTNLSVGADIPSEGSVAKPENHNAALQQVGQSAARPPASDRHNAAILPGSPLEIYNPSEQAAVERVKANPAELQKLNTETGFRAAAQELIKEAKEGKHVTFVVDTLVPITDANGKPTKATQTELLYQELQKAYPENAYVFSKPDLHPGDKGYSEIPAPDVNTNGLHISTKENQITLAKDVSLPNGTKIPTGSKFAVGTTFDGKTLKSADLEGKVWAISPEGNYIQVADSGKSVTIPDTAISSESTKMGQIINAKTADGHQNHIIVRTLTDTDPDGKPLLDAYPSGGKNFNAAYKPGSRPGYWAVQPKQADHFKLPIEITVHAKTARGDSMASGRNQDYFMKNGYADAKDSTAANYTGETDPKSAQELLRIRKELGLTDPIQAQAGLRKTARSESAEPLQETTWHGKTALTLTDLGRDGGSEKLPADFLTTAELKRIDDMRASLEQRSDLSPEEQKRANALRLAEKDLASPSAENRGLIAKIREGLGDTHGTAAGIAAVALLALELMNARKAQAAVGSRATFGPSR